MTRCTREKNTREKYHQNPTKHLYLLCMTQEKEERSVWEGVATEVLDFVSFTFYFIYFFFWHPWGPPGKKHDAGYIPEV